MAFSQETFYLPNGKKIPFAFTKIQDILDSLKFTDVTVYDTDLGSVYFKCLTNKPLFVILKKPNPSNIQLLISSYKYGEYLFSYSYYSDLTKMMEDGVLSRKYLVEYFGNPDVSSIIENGITLQIFNKYNLRVEFADSIASKIDVINFNAIKKNELSILYYKVTGEEYSIGFNLSFYNKSKKTIKYIYITVTAFNPVDDIIGTKTVKAIGPITESDVGSYDFKDTFYSESASKLAMIKMKIQYMDGTIRELNKTAIRNIRIMDWDK
jgi:hypothetical protein